MLTSGMWMHMKVPVMMLDRFIRKMHSNQIKCAMPNASLGRDGVGKLSHLNRFSSQEDSLETVLVIQMNTHGRNDKVMGVVLEPREPIGKPSFVMIEDVGQGCYAIQRILPNQSITPDFFPDHVSDGF
jgi:hypothetical protein